jgi:hypothetical protein
VGFLQQLGPAEVQDVTDFLDCNLFITEAKNTVAKKPAELAKKSDDRVPKGVAREGRWPRKISAKGPIRRMSKWLTLCKCPLLDPCCPR